MKTINLFMFLKKKNKECIHEYEDTGVYYNGVKNPQSSTCNYSFSGFILKCKKCGSEVVKTLG